MEPKDNKLPDEDQYWLERAREAEKSGFLGAEEVMAAIEKRLEEEGNSGKERAASARGLFKDLAPGRSLSEELIAERRQEADNE